MRVIYSLNLSLWALISFVAISCQTEDADVNNVLPTEGITFAAAVCEGSTVQTRVALEDITKDISSDPYNMDFFVQLDYNDPESEGLKSEIKRYRVASGYAGRLNAKYNDKKLKWQDAKSDHMFYAWTLPWVKDTIGYDNLEDYYDSDKEQKIKVVFHDSDDGDNYTIHQNNAILETFIGAQIGPYNYKQQGTYVPLTFYHLVSQIRLGKLIVIRGDGSRHEDLKANLTFIGMPKEAVFDPHPYNYISNPHPAEWIKYSEEWNKEENWSTRLHHPVVIGPKDGYEEDSELTFFIPESAPDGRIKERFYVCPEVDFSKLTYKVVITSKDAEETGIEYYGDFSTIDFKRDKEDPYDKGGDGKVLHAGEMMTLNITLYPGVGPGATITIQDWNDPQPTEALQHSHKGIYTDGEAQRLVDVFGDNPTQDEIDNLFDLYGEEVGDEKVFKLYENVEVNGSDFPVGEGYVVDGMGHTITMTSTNNTITIGNMRDVYIAVSNYMIWVDAEGKIWMLKDGDFVQTNYQLDGNSQNYQINLTTGQVTNK